MKDKISNIIQKTSPVFRTASSLLSYTGCIAVSFMIMYYLNGTIGVFLASSLISALILSLMLTFIASKTLSIEISTDTEAAAKGETLNCIVKLSNSAPLPVPVAEIETECSPQLSTGEFPIYKGAVAGRSVNTINIPMTAVHSGLATIRIKRVALSDFLGIFSFPLKISEEQRTFKVAVYPDIPDAAVQTDFLKTARFSGSDDEEEESNETSPIPTGLPGYDHREYIPGDPIKRINWKMSSKRDIYMVRLDEQIRGTGQMFFLDCPVMEDTDYTLTVRDNVIEGALAMLGMLAKEGRDAFFYFCSDGLWLGHEIHEQKDIYTLQEMLADLSPCETTALVPGDITNAGKTPICFTAAVKDRSESVMQIMRQFPEAMVISALDAGLELDGPGCWVISQEFEFTRSDGSPV